MSKGFAEWRYKYFITHNIILQYHINYILYTLRIYIYYMQLTLYFSVILAITVHLCQPDPPLCHAVMHHLIN